MEVTVFMDRRESPCGMPSFMNWIAACVIARFPADMATITRSPGISQIVILR